MIDNTLYYFTDASIVSKGKDKKPVKGTFGIIKLMFTGRDISFYGGVVFNCINTDINSLEMMAIIGSLIDIGVTRYEKVKIVTDSDNCYYVLKSLVMGNLNKAIYPNWYSSYKKSTFQTLSIFAANRYCNLLALTYDISIDVVKSHVHVLKQLNYLKSYKPDIDIGDAANYNRGNMIIDDIVHGINDTNIIEVPYIKPEDVMKGYLDFNQIQKSDARKLIPCIH